MNDERLKKLLAAARNEPPPVPPDDFSGRVLGAIRREQRAAPPSIWEQLERLFPRLAVATVLLMLTCVLADFCYSTWQPSDLESDVGDISDQWMLATMGEAHE